jgi:hypothetical protein
MNTTGQKLLPLILLVLSQTLGSAGIDNDKNPLKETPIGMMPGHSATGVVVKETNGEIWINTADPCKEPHILVFVSPHSQPKKADSIECGGKTYERVSITQK